MSFMNRMGNAHNIYQTDAKRVLCLCSAGMLRSPTTANVLHKEYGYNTRAAGISSEYALVVADDVLYEWADEIVCMEWSHSDKIPAEYLEKIIIVLEIPDIYQWNDPELIELIKNSYKRITEDTARLAGDTV